MSTERYSTYQLVYEHGKKYTHLQEREKSDEYAAVLSQIQSSIAKNYANELYDTLYDQGQASVLQQLIVRHITSAQLVTTGVSSIAQLADMIYNDMAGFGPITPYLKDPHVEEININGWNLIYIVYSDRKVRLTRGFNSPEECAEVVRKMARSGGVILDGTNPIGDSYISQGVRMSGIVPPCVDYERGDVASIRKQKPSVVTRENVIAWNTATEKELDFLTLCINCGVSLAFVGETGSGKTSDMNMLLSTSKPSKRFFIIEDNRETQIQGNARDAVYMLTKEQYPPITMNDGLRLALRFDPDIIVPSEMRGEEANTAVESGRTGHTIVSTLHANSAQAAYQRIMTMMLMAGTTLSETRILKNIVESFPIIVYKTKLPDGSRKYMEIFEATGVKDGEVIGNMIFKYRVDHHDRDEFGEVMKTYGDHLELSGISPELADRLCAKGADRIQVEMYTKGEAV